jgi:hypothetical protein
MSGPFIGTPNAELGLMVHGNIVGGRVHPHRVGSGKRERPRSSGVDRLPTIGEF